VVFGKTGLDMEKEETYQIGHEDMLVADGTWIKTSQLWILPR